MPDPTTTTPIVPPTTTVDDGSKKGKTKIKVKKVKDLQGQTKSQYGTYSGIRTDKGDVDNPTDEEAITNMVGYMKNNRPPEADSPSNVYRPKFSHLALNYKKKNQDIS